MFLKCFVVAGMVLFSGSVFSQVRFEKRSSESAIEWRLPYSGQQENELLIYNQWKLNFHYTIELKKNFKCSFLTLNNLARAAESINENSNEALECLNSLLVKNERNRSEVESDFETISGEADGAVRWLAGG